MFDNMKKSVKWLIKHWFGILMLALLNFIVSTCATDIYYVVQKDSQKEIEDYWYTSKICSESKCDKDMSIGCIHYCYNKEAGK